MKPALVWLALTSTLLSALLGAACSDDVRPPSTTSEAPGATSIARGRARAEVCRSCHGDDLAGGSGPAPGNGVTAPNLTPDRATGVGDWTDEALATAIRSGVDDEATPLCSSMPRFTTLDDQAVAELVAYLRSLPPIARQAPEGRCDDEDAGPCDGLVAPEQRAPCDECAGGRRCAPNGCADGRFCEVATRTCRTLPYGC